MTAAPLLEARRLTKSFGGALALDGVDLTVLPGEVHGLLGENGSGKSTLIKILAGYHVPDGGTLAVSGQDVRLPLRPGEYRELGFEFVHQDLGLVPSLSVAENLFLGEIAAPSNRYFLSWSRATRRARQVFDRYGLAIDPRARAEDIRAVERALLAIVRALEGLRAEGGDEQRPTLLVLDEPTVFLPQNEVALLFDFVRGIAARGSSVLFVSHDLDEVREITDRVTVLRDGRVAGTVTTASTGPRELVRLIIGHDLGESTPEPVTEVATRPVVLSVRNLTTRWLQDVSFDLHEGEVLGFTGLVGSGYEDLVYALYGATRASAGSLAMDGRRLEVGSLTPHRALAEGMALVPADRQRDGSVPTLSAAENINLPVLDRHFSGLRLHQRDLDDNARRLMTDFDVRPPRPELDYGSFSGGNQQKAMMAKWHQVRPRVLLLHEPTQGVDVGARQQIFSQVREGTAVSSTICASSDYDQLAAICDRVAVIGRGRLLRILTGADVTKERIADFCLHTAADDTVVGTPDTTP